MVDVLTMSDESFDQIRKVMTEGSLKSTGVYILPEFPPPGGGEKNQRTLRCREKNLKFKL